MTDTERYDDPGLAARTADWMRVNAPAAAPERLVFSVMDDVERSPRAPRRALLALPAFAGFVRYTALTLVITIGVAAGIVVSRNVDNVGGPSPEPTPTPSLRFLGDLRGDGRLLASDANRAWLVTSARQLVPLDAEGLAGEPLDLTFSPSDLEAISDASADYGGPETVWLVGPDNDLLRLDPTEGELVAVTGSAGTRIALGSGSAWVSRTNSVVEVDGTGVGEPSTIAAPGHAADAPILVADDQLWVVDGSGVARLDPSTGRAAWHSPASASALITAGGEVWAAEGPRLVVIDPGSGAIARSAALPQDSSPIVALATHGSSLWLATQAGPRGPLLIGVDAASGTTTSVTPLTTPAISIAVVGNQVWTLDAAGHVGRFEPG